MLGLYQPMSSPMITRTFIFFAGACAAAEPATTSATSAASTIVERPGFRIVASFVTVVPARCVLGSRAEPFDQLIERQPEGQGEQVALEARTRPEFVEVVEGDAQL